MEPGEMEQMTGGEAELIPDAVVREVAEVQRARAELATLTTRLRDWPAHERLLAGTGEVPEAYLRQTLERRAALTGRLRGGDGGGGEAAVADPMARLRAGFLDVFSDAAGWWLPRAAPIPAEGTGVTPDVAGSEGEIAAVERWRSGVAFSGRLVDSGTRDPLEEKWWLRNWRTTITFPQARQRGRLAYRFEVVSRAGYYDHGQLGGRLMTFVTLGTTPDVRRPIANWRTVAWPVDVALPRAERFPAFAGVVPVRGAMEVREGQTPAVGLILGVIVGLASGSLWLHPNLSSFETLMVEQPPGSDRPRSHAMRHGKIEYRYDPRWWLDAVDRIALERDLPDLGG